MLEPTTHSCVAHVSGRALLASVAEMALQLHSDTVGRDGAGQHFEQQQQHGPGPIRSRSSTPRVGGPARAPNGRTSSPELSDFLDAASVALYSVPYLRERLVNLQVSF